MTIEPEPPILSPDVPSPLPAAPPNETVAWTIATLPLLGVVAGYLADMVSTSAGNGINMGVLAATFYVMRQDKRQIIAAGHARAPSLWWVLVPPVFLWKRANILGRSKAPFWLMIAIYIVTFGITGLLAAVSFGIIGAPSAMACKSAESDVVRLWNGIDGVKRANLVGERLTDISETAFDDSMLDGPRRSCRAVLLSKDGGRHDVDYVLFIEQGKGRLQVTAH